jgi:hypothetical protein
LITPSLRPPDDNSSSAFQPLPAPDRSLASGVRPFLHDQPVAQSLVVALPVIMVHEFPDGLPQRSFSCGRRKTCGSSAGGRSRSLFAITQRLIREAVDQLLAKLGEERAALAAQAAPARNPEPGITNCGQCQGQCTEVLSLGRAIGCDQWRLIPKHFRNQPPAFCCSPSPQWQPRRGLRG